jgi:uncharacterized protein DUF397
MSHLALIDPSAPLEAEMTMQHENTRIGWKKSSYSAANGDCVETAVLGAGVVGVRDSKDPAGPVLRFSADSWAAFVSETRKSGFTA